MSWQRARLACGVPDYVLSGAADADLTAIYEYSYRTFGEAQADAYVLGLRDTLTLFADRPRIGHPAEDLHPGLLRHPHGSHVIFYLRETDGILVVRILHQSMDSSHHLAPDPRRNRGV